MRLYYNRIFSEDPKKPEFRSYSVKLRPDFTIVVRCPAFSDRVSIVNFDAEYKSKPYKEENLDIETDDLKADS